MTSIDGLITQIGHIRDDLTCEVLVKGLPCGQQATHAFRWGCSCIVLVCAGHRAEIRERELSRDAARECEKHRMTNVTLAKMFKL